MLTIVKDFERVMHVDIYIKLTDYISICLFVFNMS